MQSINLREIKYIIGLGNPGREYATSPHNLGFIFIDMLRKQLGDLPVIKMSKQDAWRANNVILSKPKTYMNLSGEAITELRKNDSRNALDFVKSILVVHDDISLPMHSMKYKDGSIHKGLGAHNGLRSIANAMMKFGLKMDDAHSFHRLRMGCEVNARQDSLSDYVTAPMKKDVLLKWFEVIDEFLCGMSEMFV